jgi:hypothetical protein
VLLSEEEWLERREAAARADLKRAVLGLGESVREALQLPQDTCRHPLVHDALSSAGDFLGSEAALDLIEGSLGLPPSPLAPVAATLKKIQQVSALASRLSS